MRRRDHATGIHRDDRKLFYEKYDENDYGPRAKRRAAGKAVEGVAENLEDTKGHSIKEWVSMLGSRTEIANRFNSKGQYVHRDKVRRMCEQNKSSFVIANPDLANSQHALAYFLPETPFKILEINDKVSREMVLSIYPTQI
ncbi:DNA replication licensing factor Mcm2-like [Uranotaenia lowii]|uniref:DNA replication licensing factor Mcm2-like n=1 Tax=Uranotaenia lowii TaxID=190385 RepID=UPI0024795655|nr:DNA replication licensing factor Mcm2-like [Uranotaenia lowii]